MGFYSGFSEYYEGVFPFREEVYAFLRRRLPDEGTRILDVGCGTGHYCGRFAAEGCSVRGIDNDDHMIARARAAYPRTRFSVLDMASAGRIDGPFDLAYCIGNVAAHASPADLRRMIAGIAGLLPAGGIWILQTVNWDYLLGKRTHRFPPRQLGPGEPRFLREYHDISPDGLRFVTRLEQDGKTLFAGEVSLYPMRAQTYMHLHAEAGFELREHAADFRGTAFHSDVESGNVMVFSRIRG